MKAFAAATAVAAVAWAACAGSAFAQDLPGPDAVVHPYVHIPFLASRSWIVEGTRREDGGCEFPIDMTAAPGLLGPRQKLLRVQRAVDPVACTELVEEGLIDTDEPAATAAGLGSVSAAAASGPHSGTGEIGYTDGNQSWMKIVRETGLVDGVPMSSVLGGFTYTPPADCNSYGTLTNRSDNQFHNDATSKWTLVSDSGPYFRWNCYEASVERSVVHANYSSLKAGSVYIYDCSQGGARIRYAPFKFTISRQGAKSFTGKVYWEGDAAQCGSLLWRYQLIT